MQARENSTRKLGGEDAGAVGAALPVYLWYAHHSSFMREGCQRERDGHKRAGQKAIDLEIATPLLKVIKPT